MPTQTIQPTVTPAKSNQSQPSLLPKPNIAPTPSPSKTYTIQRNPNIPAAPNVTPIQPKPIAPTPQQLTPVTPTPIQTPAVNSTPGTPNKQNMVVGIQSLGANTVTIKDGQLIVQGPDHAAATQIAQLLSTGAAKLANLNGKQVLLTTAPAKAGQQAATTPVAPPPREPTPPPPPREPTPPPPREPSPPPSLMEVQSSVEVPGFWKFRKSPSSWSIIKLADFLKKFKSKAFWESSFVLLVISGLEMATLNIQKAALMLGVDIKELAMEMRKLRNEEEGSLSKNTLAKIKSEVCIVEPGDCEDSVEANDLIDEGERRGVKRRVSSSWANKEDDLAWITGEVVVHLLKRSFALKDKLFLQDGRQPVLVLRISWPFYESNVLRVVKEIEEYCGSEGLLMESLEVQELLKAAQHLDCQRMEGGGYALAPAYNYSRCMLEEKADYWETELPAKLLKDVGNKVMPAELAACQLGVTTTMIFSALALKRLRASNMRGPVTMKRYKEFGFGGEEDFWKELTTLDMLQKVCCWVCGTTT